MIDKTYFIDWAEIAFGDKKTLKALNSIYIAPPRDLSVSRFLQIVRKYLPDSNLVFGISKENFVLDLEKQNQFKMLGLETIAPVINTINQKSRANHIFVLSQSQSETKYIIEKVNFKLAIFINGSWYRAFHRSPEFYELIQHKIPYKLISPFASETEAKAYSEGLELARLPVSGMYTLPQIFGLVRQSASHSFDYAALQTGAALGRKMGRKYELLTLEHNQIVPYEAYAMHFGSARERNFTPVNDLNNYDTIHAEVLVVLKALEKKISLKGTTLFVNLLPCPTCARMLAYTQLDSVFYTDEHSAGQAVGLLESKGKKVIKHQISQESIM